MVFKEWLIEHSIEIASLIVTIIGFWVAGKYLIRINNKQNISLVNSPNSPVTLAGRDINSSDVEAFRKGSKKGLVFSEESIKQEDNPKKQIKKIEEYLDENKKISLIAEMSLRLAKELKMNKDEKWLEKEVHGFREYFRDESFEGGLKMKKSDGRDIYRRIEAELHVMTKGGNIEKFDVPMFFSQPIRQIEEWAERYSKEQKIIMNAPPMELMVKHLNVDPKKNVPYLVNPSSFNRILNEVRLKIIEFLDKAKKNINNTNYK
ncbi:MAG: hypothetical protein ABIH59_02670 [archaeon]